MKENKKIVIEVKSISKVFSKDKNPIEIISGLNLNIYEGEFTVIMGRSGAGKSTLLYCMSAMDPITDGEVVMNGADISKLKEKELSKIRTKNMAFIFQSFNLLNDLTLFQNVAYIGYKANKNKNEVNIEVDELLKKLDIYEVKDKYPNEVSGGQKQRAAIARALINKPEIIFGDEPTGALNSSASESVLNILEEINNNGQTIILVTHDLKVASRATRLVYLKDGKIDGELNLEQYEKGNIEIRESKVIEFLNAKGW